MFRVLLQKKMIKQTDCSTCKTAFIQLVNSALELVKFRGRQINKRQILNE